MQWLLRFNEMEETVYGIYALANAVELNRGFFFYFPCTYISIIIICISFSNRGWYTFPAGMESNNTHLLTYFHDQRQKKQLWWGGICCAFRVLVSFKYSREMQRWITILTLFHMFRMKMVKAQLAVYAPGTFWIILLITIFHSNSPMELGRCHWGLESIKWWSPWKMKEGALLFIVRVSSLKCVSIDTLSIPMQQNEDEDDRRRG